MLDMVIKVMYVYLPYEAHVNLRIKWFNRRGMDIHTEETVKIKNEEFGNWYEWEMK